MVAIHCVRSEDMTMLAACFDNNALWKGIGMQAHSRGIESSVPQVSIIIAAHAPSS